MGLWSVLSPGANGVPEAAGVLVSDATRSLGAAYSLAYIADTVGDKFVKGWWKDEDHTTGVLGTVGKGYEGVRRARAAGVGGTLPRIVFEDSVDSVDVVWPVGNGVLKAPSSVGDILAAGAGSSLIGDTRRAPRGLDPVALAALFIRTRCCFWIAFNCRLRSLSISSSSGDDFPCGLSSGLSTPPRIALSWRSWSPSAALSPTSVSVSVVSSSCSCAAGRLVGGSCAGSGWRARALGGRRCSKGRAAGGDGGYAAVGEGAVSGAVTLVGWAAVVDLGDGSGALFIVASPYLPSGGTGERTLTDAAEAGLVERGQAVTFA